MSTGSLRRRVMAAVLGLLLVVVVGFGAIVTVAYHQSRVDDVHKRLAAGARALSDSWPSDLSKGLIAALNLEGISVELRPARRPRAGAAAGARKARRPAGASRRPPRC